MVNTVESHISWNPRQIISDLILYSGTHKDSKNFFPFTLQAHIYKTVGDTENINTFSWSPVNSAETNRYKQHQMTVIWPEVADKQPWVRKGLLASIATSIVVKVSNHCQWILTKITSFELQDVSLTLSTFSRGGQSSLQEHSILIYQKQLCLRLK